MIWVDKCKNYCIKLQYPKGGSGAISTSTTSLPAPTGNDSLNLW
jgi:hypothetical protein